MKKIWFAIALVVAGCGERRPPAPTAEQNDQLNEADHQRCVDVAVNRNDIQIQFDPLKTEPALNVTASPDDVAIGAPVTVATYSNYARPTLEEARRRGLRPGWPA